MRHDVRTYRLYFLLQQVRRWMKGGAGKSDGGAKSAVVLKRAKSTLSAEDTFKLQQAMMDQLEGSSESGEEDS